MLSDLRFALRQLAKSSGFTGIAILTLALGIGLNTSMFSLMNLLVLRPLPFPERDQLVRVYRTTPQSQTARHYYPGFIELAPEVSSFATLAAWRFWNYALAVEGRPAVNLNSYRVSPNIFSILGVQPALGRFFTAEEDRPGNHAIVLGYATWQAHFGGDPAVIGRTVTLDNEPVTIIGVAPASLASTPVLSPGDVFRPLALTDSEKTSYGSSEVQLLARMQAGITLEQFNARLKTIAANLGPTRPADHAKDGLRAVSLQSSTRSSSTVGITVMLLALAGFVLLIACGNLANLQLARAISRAHEHAIRAALGASRSRLLRPSLVESMLLAVGGGALGVLIAVWTNDWLSRQLSANGGNFELTLEWQVLAFALALSLLTGVIFGLAPAWLISRTRVNETLKIGTRGSTGDRMQHRLRHSLIVLQFANALVLLAGAGFVIAGVDKLLSIDPGWKPDALARTVLTLPQTKYATPQQSYAFYTRLEERLSALPGVQDVTVAWTLPFFSYLTNRAILIEGQERPPAGHEPTAGVNGVEPSYLDTLQIKLVAGRNFTAADGFTSAPVAIVNASLARALFPDGSALGRRISVAGTDDPVWAEIVGVMPDIKMALAGVAGDPIPFHVLRSLAQEPWNYVTVAVRSERPELLVQPMAQTIAALDPNLAVQELDTVDQAIARAFGGFRMIRTVLICFAGLGLFLAALGLYGVIARLVAQRTPEIGIRMALGARGSDVTWLILGSGLRLIAYGAAIGIGGSIGLYFILSRWSQAPVINVPAVFVIVTAILFLVGLLACWLPARRATKVDPMTALRAE
jgi:putative ABC transport system permease protein